MFTAGIADFMENWHGLQENHRVVTDVKRVGVTQDESKRDIYVFNMRKEKVIKSRRILINGNLD
jgi:hypothetical protein